ncbi:MAG: dicarboxylate/amino acid:cation symporter [Candidatus Pelethousia sp.]|nr:dicarboxylate/amino acid:cation symporter [Candidatus Pelethousia sp.]
MEQAEKKKLHLTVKILIGLIAGIIVGIVLNLTGQAEIANTYIKPFGTLFLNLIKMVIVPLVFSSLVMGACGLGDIKKVGRVGLKTIVYFMATTAFAVILGLIIGKIFNVGHGLTLPTDAAYEAPAATNFVDTLLNIIPTNPFNALAQGNMLQVIAFALFVGVAIAILGPKAETFKKGMEGFAEIMYSIIGGIMKLAPYAVFALIIPVVATQGAAVLGPLFMLVLAVYLACALHAAIIYSLTVKLLGKMSPVKFFKLAAPAMLFAYTTASSSATLPFSMESSRKMGVSPQIRSFVLPLGATVNMDGTAAFQGICALFVAAVYGIDLTLGQMAMIVLSATLASIGTAGVPGAGTVMLGMVLTTVGLPLEAIVIIMGVERIMDMARTCINVTGDMACAVVVAKSENELDEKYTQIEIEA